MIVELLPGSPPADCFHAIHTALQSAVVIMPRTMFRIGPASVFIFLLTGTLSATIPAPDHPLSTLRQGHPRLIATDADFDRLREFVRSDSSAAAVYAGLKHQADKMLDQPPV